MNHVSNLSAARRSATVAAAFLFAVAALAAPAAASVKPGDAAPDFTLPDVEGIPHTLSDHAGSWVVLEWINFDCPFVQKHYRSGNMPALQKKWRDQGVVWYAINSSAKGKQGHFETAELKERIAAEKAAPTAYLLDTNGKTGRAYGAQVTPHMYVIDPEGALVYVGAIDDKATTKLADVKTARNHVEAALTAAMAGKPVSPVATKAYGCSVKY